MRVRRSLGMDLLDIMLSTRVRRRLAEVCLSNRRLTGENLNSNAI